jgi:predicted nucleic acid-binding protein
VIALDTNLLIYAHREGSPEHEGARRAILAALDVPRGWGICLPSIVEFGERLMRWAVSLKIRGRRIFDLQIAVIAYEHGVHEIWTHDRDFASIPSVKVIDPLQSL